MQWNRRRFRRVAVGMRVQYVVKDRIYPGRAEDISETGVKLRCGIRFRRAEKVSIFMALPLGLGRHTHICRFEGKIVWSGTGLAGVAFSEPSPQGTWLLSRFVHVAAA